MTGLDALRKQLDHRASIATGRSPYAPRLMAGQIGAADLEALVHNLPPDTSVTTMLQTPTGAFFWTLSFDNFESEAVLS